MTAATWKPILRQGISFRFLSSVAHSSEHKAPVAKRS